MNGQNQDAGFSQVRSTVHSRLDQDIHWNQNTPEDAFEAGTVGSLLHDELSPDSAVQVAMLKNPKLQGIYASLGIAQADLVQAGLLKNPVISFDMRFPGRPHYPIDVNIEQEFVDLFLLPLRQKIAASRFEQAKLEVTDSVLRHAFTTRAAFFKLQGSMQLADLRRTPLAAADASADAATKLHDAGNIADLPLGAESRAARSGEAGSCRGRGAGGTKPRRFESAAGGVGPAGHLDDLESFARSAGRGNPPEDIEAARPAESPRSGGRQTVRRNRPRGRLCGLCGIFLRALGVSYAREADVASTVGPSVRVPVPLFDQGQAARARAEATLHQAQAHYESAMLEVRVEVRTLYSQMISAHARAHALQTVILPRQHLILEQTQLHYNAMAAGIFDILNARQSEITATADYVQSLTDYWTARARLQRAVGGQFPTASGIQPATAPATLPSGDTK